ncbi:MAG: heme exporter protein CcmB [Chitinophagaceae bacterium]|nr:heme exporter protein CcmB [Oligoflexus sp.]
MKTFLAQYRALLWQAVQVEWANAERWLSPLLFSGTMILLFVFTFGTVEPKFIPQLYIAATFLTAFFSLQISFSRVLEPDMQDRVFDQLRTYPISPSAWFLSKYTIVIALGVLILAPTLFLSDLFLNVSGKSLLNGSLAIIALMALLSLGALGVLLSTMMLRSNAKQILYPLIYFPLTIPVLLSAVESSHAILVDGKDLSYLMSSWLGLLVIFGIMYFTLCLLLFGELVKPE